jgi:hypothetical protein
MISMQFLDDFKRAILVLFCFDRSLFCSAIEFYRDSTCRLMQMCFLIIRLARSRLMTKSILNLHGPCRAACFLSKARARLYLSPISDVFFSCPPFRALIFVLQRNKMAPTNSNTLTADLVFYSCMPSLQHLTASLGSCGRRVASGSCAALRSRYVTDTCT